ncbi:MAG: heparinase II/III domain-containing protein [Armatimonadota bacterium]
MAWLAGSQAEEILSRHVEYAADAFLEPGLHDRLRQEQISSLQGGTKVFRIGNSLRVLSHHLAMLAFGNSLGVSIPDDVWQAVDSTFIEMLLAVGEMNFQGRLQRDPDWKSDLWTADIGVNLALSHRLKAPLGINPDEFRHFIIDRCFMPIAADWVDDASRIHSLDSMGHNWWSVIVGGACIIAALCDLSDQKQRMYRNLVEWFHFPGSDFSRKRPNFGTRGDFVEGFGYAEYALKSPCRLALIDPDFKLVPDCLSQTQLDGLVQWFLNAFIKTNDGCKPLRFSDIHGGYKPSPDVMHTLAGLTGNDEIIRLTHQLTPEPAGIFDFLLWEPEPAEPPASRTPGLLKPDVFDNSGLAFINGDRQSLAVRSGEAWGHNHLDAGSFIFADNGVMWIDDSGTCEYTKPEYPNYFVLQDAHNVAYAKDLASDVARIRYEGSTLTGRYLASEGDGRIKMLQADTSILNGGKLLRSIRSFFMLDDEALVIWDDLSGYDDQRYTFLLHTPCEIDVEPGNRITLRKDDDCCPFRFFSSSETAFAIHDEVDGNRSLRWESEAVLRQKFGLAAGTAIKSTEWSTTRESDWVCSLETSGTRYRIWFNRLADGRVMHQNCIGRFDGIETDAYALILTEGNDGRRLTAIQGSLARTESEVFVSSLSRVPMRTVGLG